MEYKTQDLVIKEIKADDNSVVAVISSQQKDLDNEVIVADGIKYDKYLANGGLFIRNHDLKALPIGKVLEIKQNSSKETLAKIQFSKHNAEAKTLLGMIKDNELSAKFSIGFKRIKDSIKDGIKHLDEIELFEVSLVNLPANVDTRIVAKEQSENLHCLACEKVIEIPCCSKDCFEITDKAIRQAVRNELQKTS